MLGIKFDDHLFEKIEYLTRNNIELNCQIVLCPGLNDGLYLERTIFDLKQYFPMIRSIAIVPVGLTKHRKNLYKITPVTHAYSIKTIAETDKRRKKLKNELGSSFVYLSDEFYIRTRTPIPGTGYYEGFYQLENGVGLTRDFMDRFDAEFPNLLQFFCHRKIGLTLVTGDLGNTVLNRYFAPKLDEINNIQYEIQPVVNQYYGSSIVVSGLLVGQDIYNTLRDKNLLDYIILPPNCLNDDGLFLDDWTIDQLEGKLRKKILVFPDSFLELFEQIQAYETTFSDNYR
jgi:putative radical SAM enzyme (TIGR03279 family)